MRETSGAKYWMLNYGMRLAQPVGGRRSVCSRLGKCYVDGGSVEDGAACDKDDLYHEAREREGIVVHDDASNVSDNLNDTTEHHKGHVPPGPPVEAEEDVDAHGDGVEDDEGDVCSQAGLILVDAPLEGAEVEGTVGIRAKDDDVLWKLRVGRHDGGLVKLD